MTDDLIDTIIVDDSAERNLIYSYNRLYPDDVKRSVVDVISDLRSRMFSDDWINRLSRSTHTMNQIIVPLV